MELDLYTTVGDLPAIVLIGSYGVVVGDGYLHQEVSRVLVEVLNTEGEALSQCEVKADIEASALLPA